MKATDELLDLETYLNRMQMTKEEVKQSLDKLYKGQELARYIYSDDLCRKASFKDGQVISQFITELYFHYLCHLLHPSCAVPSIPVYCLLQQ